MLNFLKILQDLKDFADSEVPLDLLFIAVNETKAEVANRIFNSETGTTAKDGKKLRAYSQGYAEYRRSLGRQTKVVDLELTGSLRRELKVFKKNESITMGFLSKTETKKIGYLEKGYKKTIFEANKDEVASVNEKANKLFLNEIKTILENGSK
jgi:hypothetical protein